jgi:2-(1,2-epoxy-1,2-dihydrophenyl)acetyl-CoA isomerase
MKERQVQVSRKGSVASVTMNRPAKLNALTLRMWDELVEAFAELVDDDDVHVIVLTGAGRGFCSGRDLDEAAEMASDQPLTRERLLEMHHALIPPIVQAPKPVLAAVNGPAAGAGFSLALACDIRIASSDARFTVAFLGRGLTPDAGLDYLLQRAVGYSKALELCLTGELIDAAEALKIGLVERVLPSANFRAEVEAIADQFASLPPLVVKATKATMLSAPLAGLDNTLEQEAVWQSQIIRDEPYREAIDTYLDSREVQERGER